jgi:transketolase
VFASLAAAGELGRAGIRASVLNAHTLKPFDADALLARAATAALVVTVEEHRRGGGLGGLVAETLAERMPRRMLRIGLPDTLAPVSGSPDHILELHGLHPREITARIMTALEEAMPIGSTS